MKSRAVDRYCDVHHVWHHIELGRDELWYARPCSPEPDLRIAALAGLAHNAGAAIARAVDVGDLGAHGSVCRDGACVVRPTGLKNPPPVCRPALGLSLPCTP